MKAAAYYHVDGSREENFLFYRIRNFVPLFALSKDSGVSAWQGGLHRLFEAAGFVLEREYSSEGVPIYMFSGNPNWRKPCDKLLQTLIFLGFRNRNPHSWARRLISELYGQEKLGYVRKHRETLITEYQQQATREFWGYN